MSTTAAASASPAPRTARSGGFTLLEVMVALAIFGLLAAAGVGVMAYATDNQGAVGERMDRLAELQRSRGVLRGDLAQVAARRIRQADGSPARSVFHGARDGDPGALLGFVRRGWANPGQQRRPSLQYVEYRIADGQLERSTRPVLDGGMSGTPQVLLTGVRAAHIRYRDHGQWSDGWSGSSEAVPEAIALQLDLERIGALEQLFLLPGSGG